MGPSKLKVGRRTLVMGVLNVTPDSFSDGGRFFDKAAAVRRGLEMASEGADIIDIGGESTRPGAAGVAEDEELRRVVPVIEALAKKIKIPISVDTRKSSVAEAALGASARIINDVSGLRHDGRMAATAARHRATVIVMHMKGEPRTMQLNPTYRNLIGEIIASLKDSVAIALRAGLKKKDIIIDPGIGFGKTARHNLEILRRLAEFKAMGCPICVGVSRKSFIGKVLGLEHPSQRLFGSIAAAAVAIANGADIIRCHDVRATVHAARMVNAILKKRR
jgi:dihydropteroate synthase